VQTPVHEHLPFTQGSEPLQVLPQVPQLSRSVFRLRHAAPQAEKFALHVVPQAVPPQVAEPFAGAGHAEHDAPQVATALLETQAPLHSWVPVGQVHWLAEQTLPPEQAVAQEPQWAESVVKSTQASPQRE
jgi:hypothetical protein